MTKEISAMDMINSDPILFVSYRMGILQTRLETLRSKLDAILQIRLETLRSKSIYSLLEHEYELCEEELAAYKQMYKLLKKAA